MSNLPKLNSLPPINPPLIPPLVPLTMPPVHTGSGPVAPLPQEINILEPPKPMSTYTKSDAAWDSAVCAFMPMPGGKKDLAKKCLSDVADNYMNANSDMKTQ